ncbi:MAG: hypothetical protein ABJN04_06995 [Hyphomicrobiales bacterium]
MNIEVSISDKINAKEVPSSLVLSWESGVTLTLEMLILERVRLEVEAQHKMAVTGLPDFHPLVAWQREASQGDEMEMRIAEAQKVALEGFSENAYFLIVDGKQLVDLDAEIKLSPNTQVQFLRLMPLKGG